MFGDMFCCSMYLLDVSYSILLPCTPVLVQIPTSSPTGVPTSAVSSFILYDMNAHQYTSKLILCIYYLSLLETLQPSNAPTSQPTSQPTDNPTKVGSTNVRRKLLNVYCLCIPSFSRTLHISDLFS